ncbi:MAG: 4-hydroxy-2-oxoheptanedioate aldolase [Gammaproteobacteria bacterium]|nr:4-hydroxy-2-oxoheptanedioate aldolase [Gammaproteobacteria bacterium]
MKANRLRERLHARKACVNGWLLLPSIHAAEAMAQTGWDSLTIDIQHGLFDYSSAVAALQAMQSYPATPLVRVPVNEPGIIGKMLDAGALGVICPMVNTSADARALVNACLYPPMGARSYGPVRARAYSGATPYHEIANDHVLVLPQIETLEAVRNIREILDVPGVSGIYVGPGDLGFSMGLTPKLDREEPEILTIYETLLAETSSRGLFAGIQNGTATYAAKMIRLGFALVTVATDLACLTTAARDTVAATRGAAGPTAE